MVTPRLTIINPRFFQYILLTYPNVLPKIATIHIIHYDLILPICIYFPYNLNSLVYNYWKCDDINEPVHWWDFLCEKNNKINELQDLCNELLNGKINELQDQLKHKIDFISTLNNDINTLKTENIENINKLNKYIIIYRMVCNFNVIWQVIFAIICVICF